MNQHLATRAYFAVGLVIYHPEKSLFKRVEQMLQLGFMVYVFDNSPEDKPFTATIQNGPNICYLTAGKNVGLGFALSTLCATAHSHGYERLLFLDQDTGISPDTLEFIEAFTKTLTTDAQQQYAALVFDGKQASLSTITAVRLAISSGSLFNLPVLRKIGWHNEKYFVDCVDYEFCLRARRHGFKIGLVKNTPDFDHVTEQPDQTMNVLGKQLLVRRYSASRIKDAMGAYLKLIIGGLLRNKPIDTYTLMRSMVLYVFGQLASRLMQSK